MEKIGFYAQEDWSVTDLYNFFHQLNILYNRFYVVQNLPRKDVRSLEYFLTNSLSRVSEFDRLHVHYLEMHSPAQFNFRGGGNIVREVRELIKDLSFRNRLEKERLSEENEHRVRTNQSKQYKQKLAVLERQVKLMRKAGYSEKEILESMRQLVGPAIKLTELMQEKDAILLEHQDED